MEHSRGEASLLDARGSGGDEDELGDRFIRELDERGDNGIIERSWGSRIPASSPRGKQRQSRFVDLLAGSRAFSHSCAEVRDRFAPELRARRSSQRNERRDQRGLRGLGGAADRKEQHERIFGSTRTRE